jgi:hypothetical protein
MQLEFENRMLKSMVHREKLLDSYASKLQRVQKNIITIKERNDKSLDKLSNEYETCKASADCAYGLTCAAGRCIRQMERDVVKLNTTIVDLKDFLKSAQATAKADVKLTEQYGYCASSADCSGDMICSQNICVTAQEQLENERRL